MSLQQSLLSFVTRVSDAAMFRRLTHAWLTTGAVPVAHIVADPDDFDAPQLLLSLRGS